eukprot:TRINITY_DN22796_c0_g1_i3.p1 TRINITY_DN22796_c0_g1~~TRINITY_DN22796_c0_g1_i3.p1  ORF type:complete len:161 (+),score=33.53 TRINITY_DN22796_c0_g1_i3:235-717(+)
MLVNENEKYMNQDVSLEESLEDYAFQLTPKEDRQWMTLCGDVEGVISSTCPLFSWNFSASESLFQKWFPFCCKSADLRQRRWTYELDKNSAAIQVIEMSGGTKVLPLLGGSSRDCIKVTAFVDSDRELDMWLPAASLKPSESEASATSIEMTELSRVRSN